ncbi:cupin domain-containing protein [Amnibacterium endophyticum]|uniref:Cupin domain-containing protein n=1 Tax=Amnibacterium endophyticum TaxID=2109337 RepID=A0ABW4LGB0_9MICO
MTIRTARDWIALLGLEPLPDESGWWAPQAVSPTEVQMSGRTLPACSAIHYLLDAGRPVNVWHRLDADDTHVHVDGGPVEYAVLTEGSAPRRTVLGHDVAGGQQLAITVPAGSWKGMRLLEPDGFALLTTVVAPGWTEDRVRVGLPPEDVERWAGSAPWLTRELVERLNRP